jgi:hypothetical protein
MYIDMLLDQCLSLACLNVSKGQLICLPMAFHAALSLEALNTQ